MEGIILFQLKEEHKFLIYKENGLITQMVLSLMVLYFLIVKQAVKRFVEEIAYLQTDITMLLLKMIFYIILISAKL